MAAEAKGTGARAAARELRVTVRLSSRLELVEAAALAAEALRRAAAEMERGEAFPSRADESGWGVSVSWS